MTDKFQFYSDQTHSVMVNGRAKITRKTVSVKNGKGYKQLTTNHGTKRVPLKMREMKNIRKHQFMSGFFDACKGACTRRRRR
jgi:hypothetical protein